MSWVLIGIGGLVGLPAAVWLVGMMLPADHVARMSIDLGAPRERVWGLVSDLAGTARWRPDVKAVEMQPPVNGRLRFTEITSDRPLPFEVMAQEPPSRQVVRVIDEGLPFGGTWTWELIPSGTGTRLMITEDGFVRNPIFRVMSRFFFPPTGTMNAYLRALAKELGDAAEPDVIRER